VHEEPSTIITHMNSAYDAIYGTFSPETRKDAEETFYRCQELLRQRGIRFHQNVLDGQWVLDEEVQRG